MLLALQHFLLSFQNELYPLKNQLLSNLIQFQITKIEMNKN